MKSPITSLYLMVHPYCDFTTLENTQVRQFREMWMQSVSDASLDPEAFAIAYFDYLPSVPGRPYKSKPSRLQAVFGRELELGRHICQAWSWQV